VRKFGRETKWWNQENAERAKRLAVPAK